jgi:hypothetical protein
VSKEFGSESAFLSSSLARSAALKELGEVIATLPFDAQTVRKAVAAVEKEGGQELLVESLATAMAFETTTRIVDASVRVKYSASILMLIKMITRTAALVQSSRFQFICSAVAIAGVAMILVMKSRVS